MLKKIEIMSALCLILSTNVMADMQTVAIPALNYQQGTSLFLIVRDRDGSEHIAGCVSCKEGKTQFLHDEFTEYDTNLKSIDEYSSAIIADVAQGQSVDNDDNALIYLYFEIDQGVDIIRVIVIKNNLLADNPFDIVEI